MVPDIKKPPSRWIKRGWFVTVVMAILITLFRALTPWANQHKGQMEHQLTLLLGEPVTIKTMQTSWYWFQPVLKLDEVLVSQHGVPVLQLNKLLVGVNLASSLWHWQVQPGVLFIDDVHLTVRQGETGWHIDGIRPGDKLPSMTTESYLPVVRWLLLQQKIIMKDVSATVHLRDGTIVPLHTLTIQAAHRRGHYRVNGRATLGEGVPTVLSLLGDLSFSSDPMSTAQGNVFLSATHVHLAPWQVLFEEHPYSVEKGEGRLQVWLQLEHGHLTQLQSSVHVRDCQWRKRGTLTHQTIDRFAANLAWKPTKQGWQWSADHVQLKTPQKSWPENAFVLEYKQSEHAYRFFVKTLMLEPMLARLFDWPAAVMSVLSMKPHGQFDNSQLGFRDGQINYFLSRFSQLGWQAKDAIPAVTNVSGALYWEPKSGRLELDGVDTTLALADQPPLHFKAINMAMDWKALNQGWRISLDHLILEHSHLLLSARGVLDGVSTQSPGVLQLTGEFSAKEAQVWLPYIPSAYLKPKLEVWLKQDVKRIGQINGRLFLNGPLADFPFDRHPGDFSISSSLNGVELFFHRKWPLARDIDAYLRVDKRVLTADVLHVDLEQGLVAENVNLEVSELGLGQETLLVHGNVQAPADKMGAYVFSSPLRQHLLKLKILSIQQILGLDLALAVPLYPENDTVLVRGSVLFNNNDVTIHHALSPLEVKHVSGTLLFDEHGVLESTLQASFLDDPITLLIRSLHDPKPTTQIKIAGEFALALMREQWRFPLFALMQGRVAVESVITLVDDKNAWDHVRVSSSLQGASVDLPAPFGKTREEHAPLLLDADFNAAKGIRLRMNYDKRLDADLSFSAAPGQALALQRGAVCLGCEHADADTLPGATLTGKLSEVDWSLWRNTLAKLPPASSTSNGLKGFRSVDLTLGSVSLFGQTYQDMSIHAARTPEEPWSILVSQANVSAELHYQPTSDMLSGHVSHLSWVKSKLALNANKETQDSLRPDQIPNLALTIDALNVDDMEVGRLSLKSTSRTNVWHVDECILKSDPYVVTFSGDWQQHEGVNQTRMQASFKANRLENLLLLWKIPPVVEAHDGTLLFNGGWTGDPRDFSLKHLTGDIGIIVNHGRITHLDPETEKKLGLGKLLSILSLQTIPRRLKLDFSDLAKAGYSFDQFEGRFVLKDGVMSTASSTIDGPVAYASMKGQLDLNRRLYDLDLHVTPHITASLPVVATIAGGPIAGIATWAASKMINQGMDMVTGYTYKISGPWLEPVVQQVHIYRNGDHGGEYPWPVSSSP